MSRDTTSLVEAARTARLRAYAPYSRFLVGAAIQTPEGVVFTGCNVENASYPLGCCAERVALYAAVAAGERRFDVIAVVTDAPRPAAPCGGCRQVLYEFNPDMEIVLATLSGPPQTVSLRALMPMGFGPSDLLER